MIFFIKSENELRMKKIAAAADVRVWSGWMSIYVWQVGYLAGGDW